MAVRGSASKPSTPKPPNQGTCASLMATAQPLRCSDSMPRDTRGKPISHQIFKNASITKPGDGTGPDGTEHRTPGF